MCSNQYSFLVWFLQAQRWQEQFVKINMIIIWACTFYFILVTVAVRTESKKHWLYLFILKRFLKCLEQKRTCYVLIQEIVQLLCNEYADSPDYAIVLKKQYYKFDSFYSLRMFSGYK